MNKIVRSTRRLLLIVTSLILLYHPTVSMAGSGALYPGMLDRAGALAAAAEVTRADYPNADTVDVDIHKWVTYREDGTYIEWFECYSKILTEKGRSSLTTISSSFTIPYNDTAFKLVEVISGDGTANPVEIEGNSRVMIEPSQMRSNIYNPNSRILCLNVPDIHIGDTLHYIIRDEFAKVRTPGTWSDYVTFEGQSPIKRSAFTVIAPRKKPLERIALKSEIPGSVRFEKQEDKDFIVYRWVAENIPLAIPEPDMPHFYTQVQRLLVSTIRDWESISRWYWQLCKPNLEKITPAMEDLVKDLTGGMDDPEEQIQAIFTWVSQKVRYLGLTVEKDAPGYEPHPVSMTFDQRAGVCRDKAALLAALLRIAGMEAYPTLIMSGPKKDPEVPQPFFNHAITAVRLSDGSYKLMDSTDENTSRMFPGYLNNKSYLVATPQGETLQTSPVESAEQNMMVISTKGSLDAHGNLSARSSLEFQGINDNIYRGFFAKMLPDEQRGFFEKTIKRFAPGAKLVRYSILPENMMDTTRPLTVELVFEAGDIRVLGKDTIMLPLARMGERLGMVHYLLDRTGLEKRKYPLYTEYACGIRETLDLKLNGAVGGLMDLPQFSAIEDQGVTWSRSLAMAENILHSKNVFKLKLPEYSPDQYLLLRETLKKNEIANRRMALFHPPAPASDFLAEQWYSAFQADAVVLNEDVEYRVENTSSWTRTRNVKVKVLTYAGKKKYSDFRMDYNPVREEVHLEKARVTDPSGKVQSVSDQEINIMDAPWVGDAPRYPGGKTMVVSLPGVEVGSIIEMEIVSRVKKQSFFSLEGDFFRQKMNSWGHGADGNRFFPANPVFRYTDPILKKSIRLEIPSDMPVKVLRADQGLGLDKIWKRPSSPVITEKTVEKGGVTLYEFTADHIAPVKPERYLPPWYSFNPALFISAGSWDTYVGKVKEALERGARVRPEITARARELIKDTMDEDGRIRAIRDFTARQIKSVDLGLSRLPLDYITPADKTLADGYGNSADRAVLLYALLKASGFTPEFILVSQSSRVAALEQALKEYPAPQWFDKVLVRVKGARGDYYLNDTDQYAELGSTPSAGLTGMAVSGSRFETIHTPASDLDDADETSYRIQLFDDGGAIVKKTTLYYGSDFAQFHKRFSEMPPEKRRRYFQEQVSSLSRGAKLQGEYLVDYDTYPGKEAFSVRVDDYAVCRGDFLYLNLPGLVSSIAGVGRDNRHNPLYRNYFHKGSVDIEVVLPDRVFSLEKIPPKKLQFNLPGAGTITMETTTISDDKGRPWMLHARQKVNIDPMVVLPDEYPQLLDMCRTLGHAKTGMVLLKLMD